MAVLCDTKKTPIHRASPYIDHGAVPYIVCNVLYVNLKAIAGDKDSSVANGIKRRNFGRNRKCLPWLVWLKRCVL